MSLNGDSPSNFGIDSNDQQPAFIFTRHEDVGDRPAKRRKVGKASVENIRQNASVFRFEPLLSGLEASECAQLRMELYNQLWGNTENRIQTILEAANEDTLAKVTEFVQDTIIPQGMGTLPTGFIATGPNIASQSLLFKQMSDRLKLQINGPIVTLRSGDISNLKAALKQVIRDATNQGRIDEDEDIINEQYGPKLLNYDLELLHRYVNTHSNQRVVIAFQDSEAFDPVFLADVIKLFDCWADRIPFTLLFGIATSVELFHERLSRAASRCLYGMQFDVKQTSSILERVFQEVIIGSNATLRLGPALVSSLMERQHDHVQSIEVFTNSLKYAYMFHFYTNPLSILNHPDKSSEELTQLLQTEHLNVIRRLPSFMHLVETLIDDNDGSHAQDLLQDDYVLLKEMENVFHLSKIKLDTLLRRMCVLAVASKGPLRKIELYLQALKGTLSESETVCGILDSIKRISAEELISFVDDIQQVIKNGSPEFGLDGWLRDESGFSLDIQEVRKRATSLQLQSKKTGKPVRSSYSIHHKGLRTTVIAQKVQLSYEKSTLSEEDVKFTALVDQFSTTLKEYFTFERPQEWFLNEIWLTDFVSPSQDIFTPRPRFALENALSTPSDRLLGCDPSVEVLSSSTVPTAILYNMYLESGSIINISDLKTSFFSVMESEESADHDERTVLMLFYRALADLKLLGMIKQSKRKVDHLAKSAWRGL